MNENNQYLVGWKSIAKYAFGGQVSIRTLQYWHKRVPLNYVKLSSSKQAQIMAEKHRVDEWIKALSTCHSRTNQTHLIS